VPLSRTDMGLQEWFSARASRFSVSGKLNLKENECEGEIVVSSVAELRIVRSDAGKSLW